jgi:hypothetical protein
MKKNRIISIIIGLTLISATLVGCKAQETPPAVTPPTVEPVAQAVDVKVFQGIGQVPQFRVGPGKDKKEV